MQAANTSHIGNFQFSSNHIKRVSKKRQVRLSLIMFLFKQI